MRRALLTALAIRLLSVLLLPQTFFQPDEYYQALEPAHRLVFGYGFLTWEWRDVSGVLEASPQGWWDQVVVHGRLRSWLWPGLFALVYKAIQMLGLDNTAALVMAPRIVGALVAACTDYATYRLAIKVLGPGAGETAMFLSLASLFNAFVLPRVLSTSPETLLVTLALTYFPLPEPECPEPYASSAAKAAGISEDSSAKSSKEIGKHMAQSMVAREGNEVDQGVLDRAGPDLTPRAVVGFNLALSAACAALAVCLRPTSLPLWAYLGAEHTIRLLSNGRFSAALRDVIVAAISGLSVIAASTAIDYAITGRLALPILSFIHRNWYMDISSFYGRTSHFYHVTQTLPILLFPIWWWWAQGFLAALLPQALMPRRLARLDRPSPLRTLARAVSFSVFVLSMSPHSEWRFLHPFLPTLLLFAIPPLFKAYLPIVPFGTSIRRTFRQYLRLNATPFYLILLSCVIPMIYLGTVHGRAPVEVMNFLRSGRVREVTGLAALMPCHSTPWMSHLHRDIPAWFLTCEPPLQGKTTSHSFEQKAFYDAPVTYLEEIFPYPVLPLHRIPDHFGDRRLPSHIILFGELLGRREDRPGKGSVTVKDALERKGYHEVWSAWNGFSWAQDDPLRQGRVEIWALSP